VCVLVFLGVVSGVRVCRLGFCGLSCAVAGLIEAAAKNLVVWVGSVSVGGGGGIVLCSYGCWGMWL
jgi:hypothetical protein